MRDMIRGVLEMQHVAFGDFIVKSALKIKSIIIG